ncbi:hypothetical protein CLONEX_00381 [[Clostridium] nexile DSM 1787]|nr:hypothetical protein CLONEX_00381 [[Clostridium] nexile DSM 1787]
MISAGDFKNGVTLEIDGNIYQILEFKPFRFQLPINKYPVNTGIV